MRVSVIGTGYVGLVAGACFSDFGVSVTCFDKDYAKVSQLASGQVSIYEPGLEAIVLANVTAGRLSFTTDLATAVDGADAVLIAVSTPWRRGDGHADLSYVFAAAEEVGRALRRYAVVVIHSTVPVGSARQVEKIVRGQHPELGFDVVSNPDFLREGSAIEDFMRPDRVVIGADSERARAVMRELYRPLYLFETPILFTSMETAELIKYTANAFLATKVTFINEIADLCEAVGADIQDVAKAIGLDGRIGRRFLNPGPGFGGSSLPRDCRALVRTGREADANLEILEAVVRANEARKHRMADKIIAACGGSVAGKTLAVLGLTFKPNTDDMRDSPSLSILPRLIEAGATIRAFDPEGMQEAQKLLPSLTYCDDAYDAIENAHALVVLTEWNEFRALDFSLVKRLLSNSLIIDLRNIYSLQEMEEMGFNYVSIGRSTPPGIGPVGSPVSEHEYPSLEEDVEKTRNRLVEIVQKIIQEKTERYGVPSEYAYSIASDIMQTISPGKGVLSIAT